MYKVWRDCGYDVNSAVVCGRFGYELKKDAHSTSASVTHGGCTVKLNTRSVMSLAPPSPVTAATPHVALPTILVYKVDVKKLYRRRGEIVVIVQWCSVVDLSDVGLKGVCSEQSHTLFSLVVMSYPHPPHLGQSGSAN